MINRFIHLLFPVLCVVLLTSCKTEVPNRPNIILFVADDHGTDALGCYGNNVIHTPNLDKLASEGVRFNNAYCTSASCAASRSVILTGKYGHATGSYGHTHDYHHFSTYDTVKSLPVLLSESGYRTARIGKYHLAPEVVYRFDEVLKADPRSTVEMALACKGVIQANNPFFLYFCTDDPHRGAPFKPKHWEDPNSFGNKDGGYPGVEQITYSADEVLVPPFLPDTKYTREELAQYYQSVSRIDQGFGKLMELLELAGKTDNTIVIYISDNGIAFPGAKTTVYEPGIKLPCIIKDPSLNSKNAVNNAIISWVDLTPTILDMAGVNFAPYKFHGKTFKNIIASEKQEGWNTMFASHTFHEITMYYPMRVYRKNNYKLIWNGAYQLPYPFATDLWASSTWQGIYRNKEPYYGPRLVEDYMYRHEIELYDLAADPLEVTNLADKVAYAAVAAEMIEELKIFQQKTQDPWMILWNNETTIQGSGVGL